MEMLDSSLDFALLDCVDDYDDCAPVFLAQSDTTAGFLCANPKKLNRLKKRDENQKILLALSDFRQLKRRFRIPLFAKKMVRNARKTSFVLPNGRSFRVVKKPQRISIEEKRESKKSIKKESSALEVGSIVRGDAPKSSSLHSDFLAHFGGLYSTSANESGKPFALEWAVQNADIIVLDSLYEAKPSKIYKLGRTKAKILRH